MRSPTTGWPLESEAGRQVMGDRPPSKQQYSICSGFQLKLGRQFYLFYQQPLETAASDLYEEEHPGPLIRDFLENTI